MARFSMDFGNAMRNLLPTLINRKQATQDIKEFDRVPFPLIGEEEEEDEIFKPRRDAQDAFNRLVNDQPERQEPGFWRRLAAGITAAGNNPEGAENIKYGKYNNAMIDWKNKAAIAKQAADLENTQNTNDRLIFGQELNDKKVQRANELAIRKQEEVERNNLTKEQQAQQKIDIANRRANAYIAKQKLGPDWKTVVDEDGEIVAWNPQTLETKKLNIKSGELSDAEKIQMDVEGNLKEIRARHEAALAEITARGEQTRTTKSTPTGKPGATDKPPTPAAANRELLNRARDIVNARPDLAKYIDTKTGVVKPIREILGWKTGDETKRNEAVALLGNASMSLNPQTNRPANKPNVPARSGYTLLFNGSQWGWVKDSDVAEALKQPGWSK